MLHRTGEGHLFLSYRRLQQKILLGRGWKGGTRYDRSYCGLELKAVWAKPLTHLSTHLSSTHNKTNGSLLCKSSLFVQRSSATLNWASYLLKLVPCDVVLVWWTSNKQAWFAFILKLLVQIGMKQCQKRRKETLKDVFKLISKQSMRRDKFEEILGNLNWDPPIYFVLHHLICVCFFLQTDMFDYL